MPGSLAALVGDGDDQPRSSVHVGRASLAATSSPVYASDCSSVSLYAGDSAGVSARVPGLVRPVDLNEMDIGRVISQPPRQGVGDPPFAARQ